MLREMSRTPTSDLHAYIHRETSILTPVHFCKQKEQGTLLLELLLENALKMSMGHRTTCPRPVMLSAKTLGSGNEAWKGMERSLSPLCLWKGTNLITPLQLITLTFKRHFMSK